MTVGELREILAKFDPNTRVVTRGFDEGGVDDIETVEIWKVRFDANPPHCHYGAHEEDKENGVEALMIDF